MADFLFFFSRFEFEHPRGEIWLSRVGISHFTGEVRRETPVFTKRVLLMYEGKVWVGYWVQKCWKNCTGWMGNGWNTCTV